MGPVEHVAGLAKHAAKKRQKGDGRGGTLWSAMFPLRGGGGVLISRTAVIV